MEKEKSRFGQKIAKFFGKMRRNFKAIFNKDYLTYSAAKYRAFTALQYKEVFSREKSSNPTRDTIFRIVTPIAKFVAVFALTFLIIFLANNFFFLIQAYSMYQLFVFFTAVMVVLQLISSTASCTKSYYIAEDNKVLITFPSSGGSLFLSKLTIEFLKELKNMLGMYIPASIALIFFTATKNPLAPYSIISAFWFLIPAVVLCAIIVLLGSVLSVLYLQYLRLVKTVPVIRIIVLGVLFAGIIYLAVTLINLIPGDIELRLIWNTIKAGVNGFLDTFYNYAVPIDFFCSIVCGFKGASYKGFRLTWTSFGRFGLLLLILIALFLIVFILIKRLFLHMMTKSVDYEKVNENSQNKNHIHHRHTTFAFKELKISFRTLEISGTYVVTYVLIPVLILLLCRIFDAINTNMRGDMLTIMFNVLLILLPLLASNTPIASAYSREGHAGYIKKTKPIRPYTPMVSKLLFNLVLSVPSIFAAMFIVGKFGKIDTGSVILLGFSVLLIQYAHTFYSSTLDFTKPRNESYQTEGQDAKNPNESVATVVAFVISFVIAGLVFFLFNEQVKLKSPSFIGAAIRLFIISAIMFASTFTLYVLKLRAYFLERQ